jgi:hypothetical protein
MATFRTLLICVLGLWPTMAFAAGPVDVSMIQLLAAPERFHGQVVRVQGFLRLEFEGNALYLHREDFGRALTRNASWVTPSRAFAGKELSDGYVLIEGEFDAKEKGHFGLFSRSIKNISRADRWPSRAELEKEVRPQPAK